ncbi:hypothetical protein CMI37_11510 [Candidatus Pacearchaeota archaeon]|nr:hypothetical protein [Candidatus Pacearchaeota archaeon]|tara:strand:+ start:1424 stop:1930 length:507 start_codon:yes stop_codon:yes gene_type:complete
MKIKNIYVHHSAYPSDKFPDQFLLIDLHHKKKFGVKSSLGYYGGYTKLIGMDGSVKRYRVDGEEQTAQKGHNFNTVSYCLAMHGDREYPSEAMEKALTTELDTTMAKYGLTFTDIKLHREVRPTDCPGLNITRTYIMNLLDRRHYQINLIKRLIELSMKLVGLLKKRK